MYDAHARRAILLTDTEENGGNMVYRRRSTEQRYVKYRKMMKQQAAPGCNFCQFSPEDKQVRVAHEHFLVTDNLFPYEIWDSHEVADHIMIVPRRHVEGIYQLDKTERAELMDVIVEYEEQGYSVYARAPENKQKSVAHQHTHLIKTHGKPKNMLFTSVKPYILWSK